LHGDSDDSDDSIAVVLSAIFVFITMTCRGIVGLKVFG